jgi:hypothetical protein
MVRRYDRAGRREVLRVQPAVRSFVGAAPR